VAYVVAKFGSPALKSHYLPRLTSMEALASYCLTEPGSGSDAASLATTAAPVEGGWLLSGSKAFISGAGASDLYLVMARCQGSLPSTAEAAAAAAVDAADAAAAAAHSGSSSGSSGPLPAGVPLPPAAEEEASALKAATTAPADSAGVERCRSSVETTACDRCYHGMPTQTQVDIPVCVCVFGGGGAARGVQQ